MRLDFNVLWVEDQPDRVQAQASAIQRRMADMAFEFSPVFCQGIDEVKARITDDVFTDEIDLVLVDWDLGEAERGQDAIVAVRNALQFKDVIFYSARNETNELRRLAFESGVEGIYCSTRNDLVEEVIGVSESLTKKVLDLDHTRGIVMGATSDIDHTVKECLAALHGKLGEEAQASVVSEGIALVRDRLKSHSSTLDKLAGAPSLPALLEKHAIFTANDGLRILSRILKGDEFGELASFRETVTTYQQEVVPRRNVLGHQVLTPEGRPVAVADIENHKEVTLEELRDLRRTLLDLRGQFRSLHLAVFPAKD